MSWLHRYAKFVALCTFFLLFAGGLVTSTGSGLSVPDWPLSFGTFFPKMTGGVFFEHGHRMVAGVVITLTVLLVFWIARQERSKVVWIAFAAMGAILLQAVLGGMTVLLKLPPMVSVLHAGLAQAFFCLVVLLALLTSPDWKKSSKSLLDCGFPSLQTLLGTTTILIYLQILLGAVMRHTGAGLAIPDFPLAFGHLVVPRAFLSFPVVLHFAHRVTAVFVALFVVWTSIRILRLKGDAWRVRKGAFIGLFLLIAQILLGGTIIWTGRSVIPTTFHVVCGALLLANYFVLFVWTQRNVRTLPVLLLAGPALITSSRDVCKL